MNYYYLCLVLIVTPVMGAEQIENIVSPPLAVISAADYEKQAIQAWRELPNQAEPVFLDLLIHTYPNALISQLMLVQILQQVQSTRSISRYHEFIQRYRGSLAAQQAIYEVFMLYEEHHSIRAYLDFIEHYPNTLQAQLARMQIEVLSFKLVNQLNRISEYDAFIDAFPYAYQLVAVENLARKKALENERKISSQLSREDPCKKSKNWFLCKRQGRKSELEEHIQSLKNEYDREQDALEKFTKNKMTLCENQNGQTQASLRKKRSIERMRYVIETLYDSGFDRARERHREIVVALQCIRKAQIDSNEKLIAVFKEEFKVTRQSFQEGIKALSESNQELQTILAKDLKDMNLHVNQLHQELKSVNENLDTIYKGFTDVQTSVNATHKELERLHTQFNQIYESIVQVHKDMTQEFTRQLTQLINIKEKTKQGFKTLHKDKQAILYELFKVNRLIKGPPQTDPEKRLMANYYQWSLDNQAIEKSVKESNGELKPIIEKNVNQLFLSSNLSIAIDNLEKSINQSTSSIGIAINQKTKTWTENNQRIIDTHAKITQQLSDKIKEIEMVVRFYVEFNYEATGFSLENAYILGLLAEAVYKDENGMIAMLNKMGLDNKSRFLNNTRTNTEAFIASNSKAIFIIFRGSENPFSSWSSYEDWVNDFKVGGWVKGALRGRVHRGGSWALDSVWSDIKEYIAKEDNKPIWITGHSLGGALATLTGARLSLISDKIRGIYTFGSPRVGNKHFANSYNDLFKNKSFRFVNHYDIVTNALPYPYYHVQQLKYFDTWGDLVDNQSTAEEVKERVSDFIWGLMTFGISPVYESINDHFMSEYLLLLRSNLNIQ